MRRRTGGTAFSNFRFTEQIPMGATLTSVLGAGGWTVPAAGPATLDLTVGSIPVDSSTLVIVTFVVDDPIPSGLNAIGNSVSGGDIPPGCAKCTVTVPTASNITFDKALTDEDGARDSAAQPGETLTCTITLTNSGGATFRAAPTSTISASPKTCWLASKTIVQGRSRVGAVDVAACHCIDAMLALPKESDAPPNSCPGAHQARFVRGVGRAGGALWRPQILQQYR